MGRPAKVPVGSRWKTEKSDRVWVVIERKPFGRLRIQEEGHAYFGEAYQRMFLESHSRLPDCYASGDRVAINRLIAPEDLPTAAYL